MSNSYMVEFVIENIVVSVFVKANSPDKALDVAYNSLAEKLDSDVNVPPALSLRNLELTAEVQRQVQHGISSTV